MSFTELKHFTRKEINDVCFGVPEGEEGVNLMALLALIKLDTLRDNVGFALTLTCAYRSKEWDLSKLRSGNSKHTFGIAWDIKCTDSSKRAIIVAEAIKLGFTGIGIHKDFIHADIRKDEFKLWLY
ncbi:hypothetical protein KAR91_29385 [Candidatus Pacearchaeota archaeon]|nr:hypothetical protein [Candidatus Pacearchaeota archaeon]